MRRTILAVSVALILSTGCLSNVSPSPQPPVSQPPVSQPPSQAAVRLTYTMKGVGIELPQSDFVDMKKAGIEILATEWGMEEDVTRVRAFLDQAQAAGLKVVMDGGFSYMAWGFTDDDWDRLPRGKVPVWQKQRVQDWVNALKDHPAIYAWDISNEFGENLPDGAGIPNSGWPKGMITIDQLKQVRADVLAADPTRPIHARMYGWDVGKMPAHVKSLLENKIADIISLNLYSNYLSHGKLEWPTVIQDAGAYFVENIKKIAPSTVVWLSVATFEYPGEFQRPTLAELNRDLNYAGGIPGLDGISLFCWGPVNEWDEKGDWYLPKTGADLWAAVKQYIASSRIPAK
jgi:hypothetical protein